MFFGTLNYLVSMKIKHDSTATVIASMGFVGDLEGECIFRCTCHIICLEPLSKHSSPFPSVSLHKYVMCFVTTFARSLQKICAYVYVS